jgi:hypothetical protein
VRTLEAIGLHEGFTRCDKCSLIADVDVKLLQVVWVSVPGSLKSNPRTAIQVCKEDVFKLVNCVYKGISLAFAGVMAKVVGLIDVNAK